MRVVQALADPVSVLEQVVLVRVEVRPVVMVVPAADLVLVLVLVVQDMRTAVQVAGPVLEEMVFRHGVVLAQWEGHPMQLCCR